MHTHIIISETTFTPQAGLPLLTKGTGSDLTQSHMPTSPAFFWKQVFQTEYYSGSATAAHLSHAGYFRDLWKMLSSSTTVALSRHCFAPLSEQTVFAFRLVHSGSNNLVLMREKTCFSGFTTQIKVPRLLQEQMKYSPN